MSATEPIRAPASSYQQILKNMRDIQDNIYPVIEKLNETIFGSDPTKSDIEFGSDGSMRVKGTSVVTDFKDDVIPPKGYFRDFTTEIKSTAAAGLDETPGFSGDYCSLFTQSLNDPDIDFPAWQLAVGDDYGAMYFRTALDDNTWGEWVPVIDLQRILWADENKDTVADLLGYMLNMEKNADLLEKLTHEQIKTGHVPPDHQVENDYWLRPVDVPGQIIVQPIDNPLETDFINEYTYSLWPIMELDRDELGPYQWNELIRINVETPWEVYPDGTLFLTDGKKYPNIEVMRDDVPTPLCFQDYESGEILPFGDIITESLDADEYPTGTLYGMWISDGAATVEAYNSPSHETIFENIETGEIISFSDINISDIGTDAVIGSTVSAHGN